MPVDERRAADAANDPVPPADGEPPAGPAPAQRSEAVGKDPPLDECATREPDRALPPVASAVEDPVEILVGLAEKGEIDPWNIDIIEVTDRFLNELERRRELNLQVSGRTLFYAATLIRMKSEQLVKIDPPEIEDEGDGEDLFGDDFGAGMAEDIDYSGRLGPIERLEHEIQRRLDRKSMRKSPITLFELITELKNIEKEERRRRRMSEGRLDSPDALIDADDVVSIAHDEGFQESSMVRLAEYLEGLELDEEMTLAELCQRMEWGIPEVFIPLLFLALDGRCTLRQEEFYGDIWVRICHVAEGEPAAESGAE